MSTLRTTYIQHPGATSPSLTLASTGAVSVNGAMAGGGLDLVASQSFSGVSSVSVNNCFTSTYANYLLVVSGLYLSGAGYVKMRFRASGTDTTTSVYKWGGQNIVYGGTVYGNSSSGSDAFDISSDPGTSSSNVTGIVMSVTNPQLATATGITIHASPDGSASWRIGQLQNSTQYDGLTIFPSAGTMSGGIVRVYGYKNS